MLKVVLTARDEALASAWDRRCGELDFVNVHRGSILDVECDAVVSPANSFGFMDGGIDAVFREFFGVQIEQTVQDAINRRPEGQLPVGASLVVRTGHPHVPYLIVAPTMEVPEMVANQNCYRALRAVLRIAGSNPEIGRDVYCPGLATGVGMVPPGEAAVMMARAYADWKSKTDDHGLT